MEYIKYRQDTIIKSDAVISSNDQSKISILKIMNHFMISNYFITSENGIAHFIHYSNPVKSENKSVMQDAIARKMLKIYLIYVGHIQSICIANAKNKNKDLIFS